MHDVCAKETQKYTHAKRLAPEPNTRQMHGRPLSSATSRAPVRCLISRKVIFAVAPEPTLAGVRPDERLRPWECLFHRTPAQSPVVGSFESTTARLHERIVWDAGVIPVTQIPVGILADVCFFFLFFLLAVRCCIDGCRSQHPRKTELGLVGRRAVAKWPHLRL